MDGKQAPRFQGLQTLADVPLVPGQGTHHVLRTTREHPAGPLGVSREPWEDPLVLSCEALGGHGGPL